MNKRMRLSPGLALLLLVLCCLAGTTASAYFLPAGGHVSTSTFVNVEGSVNDTVYVKYSTLQNGFTEKSLWESSYISQTPARQSFGSLFSLGTNGGLWWNYQRTGLPAIRMTF